MAQANDSILVTPGSGATVATHLVNSKEYQVVMIANDAGHLAGTHETFVWRHVPIVTGANKVHGDIFNATGSGVTMTVRSLRFIQQLDTAVTGIVAVRLNLTRTTAVGTGGTAVGNNQTSLTVDSFTSIHDTTDTVPAQVTARTAPTGGATAGAVILEANTYPEEGPPSGAVAALIGYQNVLEQYESITKGITVPENTGLRIVQGAVASVGNVGWSMIFTLH